MIHTCNWMNPIHTSNNGLLNPYPTLLTWTKWRAPASASKWRMGFNLYLANVDNMASSYQCYQMADGI